MKKHAVVSIAAGVIVLRLVQALCAQDLSWDDVGAGNVNIQTVLLDAANPKIIYIGTRAGISKSQDGGKRWRVIYSATGTNSGVNFLLFDPADKDRLYAATGNGLYCSSGPQESWRRVFKGKDYLENECTALAIVSRNLYLGTKAGLFISLDNGRTWRKEGDKLGRSNVSSIACNIKDPAHIYAACADGVFKSADSGLSWRRILLELPEENGDNDTDAVEDQDQTAQSCDIKYISIDANNTSCLYLAGDSGVYRSCDRGQNWELLSEDGLLTKKMQFIIVSEKSLPIAAAKSCVFKYTGERWEELSSRLMSQEINSLALDTQGNIYAATDQGLYRASLGFLNGPADSQMLAMHPENTPDILEVQKAAIEYAEVDPEKIKEWRRRAKIKAILPHLTIGIDNSKSTNYEIYTSATSKYVYEGPADRSKGFDVTLTWELSDLIWNQDQTNIDVRSKLMVQLRDDVLDEVTKLYFERIRVKMDLDNLSIEDRKKRFEKELRLQELTAYLDALTGGYFSSQIKGKF